MHLPNKLLTIDTCLLAKGFQSANRSLPANGSKPAANSYLPANGSRHLFWYQIFITVIVCLAANSSHGVEQTEQAKYLGAKDLQSLTLAWAKENLAAMVGAPLADSSRIEYTPAQLDKRLQLTNCNNAIQFEPQIQASNWSSSTRLLIKVRCSDQKSWAIFVPLDITQWRKAVVASKVLQRNSMIMPTDVEVREVKVTRAAGKYFGHVGLTHGMVVTRTIASGGALRSNDLKQPILVKRGDQVTIIANTAGITVKMNGKALANGQRNQQISVENLSSKRTIKAEVIDAGKVKAIM